MKFIHCSDLHLDSKMESNLSYQQAETRNTEILMSFSRMVTFGKENGVPVILIAGDLFDTDRVSSRTVHYVLEQIRNAPNIDFLYLKGNHDESKKAFLGQTLPENFKLFHDYWTSYTYGDVVITGAELTRENCNDIYDSLELSPDHTNIVTMHGQISTKSGEDMVCLPKLRNKHIDYLALGHIHSYQSDSLDRDSTYCYCGCLEGRGFDECGEKGFVLVDAEKHRVTTEFVPCSFRQLHDILVDITGLKTVTEISNAMCNASAEISSTDLVKFTLTGTYTLDTQKDFIFLQRTLESNWYFMKIKDESALAIEKESYENDISLKGEFVRMVMNAPLSQQDKDKIICTGIQALSGEAITL